MSEPSSFVKISCGSAHVTLIDESGRVWCFGSNAFGQLGLGHKKNSKNPTLVVLENKIVQISNGAHHSSFLDENGIVHTCGKNYSGQCGHGKSSKSLAVPKVVLNLVEVFNVCCGVNCTFFICEDGVYGVGSNSHFQLGIPNEAKNVFSPTKIMELPSDVFSVKSSGTHSLFLTGDGNVYGVGNNEHKQLGISADVAKQPKLISVLEELSVTDVACGRGFSLFLTQDGVYCVGKNETRQLGGTSEVVEEIHTIDSLSEHKVLEIDSGNDFVLFLTNKHEILVSGKSIQLLVDDSEEVRKLNIGESQEVMEVSCGVDFCIVRTQRGILSYGTQESLFMNLLKKGKKKQNTVESELSTDDLLLLKESNGMVPIGMQEQQKDVKKSEFLGGDLLEAELFEGEGEGEDEDEDEGELEEAELVVDAVEEVGMESSPIEDTESDQEPIVEEVRHVAKKEGSAYEEVVGPGLCGGETDSTVCTALRERVEFLKAQLENEILRNREEHERILVKNSDLAQKVKVLSTEERIEAEEMREEIENLKFELEKKDEIILEHEKESTYQKSQIEELEENLSNVKDDNTVLKQQIVDFMEKEEQNEEEEGRMSSLNGELHERIAELEKENEELKRMMKENLSTLGEKVESSKESIAIITDRMMNSGMRMLKMNYMLNDSSSHRQKKLEGNDELFGIKEKVHESLLKKL